MEPFFSIITISYNNESNIAETLKSVYSQNFTAFEHIIVDNLSSDNTMGIISNYSNEKTVIVREKDCGIYDALNKGARIANSKYTIILHAGDKFKHNTILTELYKEIIAENETEEPQTIFLNNIDYHDKYGKVVRKYEIKNWEIRDFLNGIMPPHLGVVFPTKYYKTENLFDLNYQIAADFKFCFYWIFIKKIKVKKNNLTLSSMILGGTSNESIKSIIQIQLEIFRILKEYQYRPSLLYPFKKLITRYSEFR